MGGHLAKMDKPVQNAFRKELRSAGKPLGEKVLTALADAMPKKGGLAERIRSQGKVSVLANLSKGVSISLANKTGIRMGAFEAGLVRHPVFGTANTTRQIGTKLVRQWRWVAQKVPAGKGKEAFDKEAPALAEKVANAATAAFVREIMK